MSTTRKLVPADFQSFQNDILSLQARDFIPYFLQIMAQSHYNRNEVREQAYQLLKGWDFVESYSSITACIFNVIFNTFLKLTFNDEMGTELFNQFLQLHGIPIHAMNNVCQNPNSKWFDNIETKTVVESRDDIILQAINQGIEELERKFGSNIGEWRWDKLHRLTFKHFFDIRKLSKSTFSIGPIPGMGGNFTINNGKFDLNRPYEQIAGATARLVIDLSDLNSSWTCITPGQSGHLFNEYFDNQLLSWQTGMLSKIHLKQDLLEQQDLRTLVLVPESDE